PITSFTSSHHHRITDSSTTTTSFRSAATNDDFAVELHLHDVALIGSSYCNYR
ncbi:hypothetical protein A2U01_0081802, partial [Trifolium medium]|nr:hypothetical protein [Trifolium medium]